MLKTTLNKFLSDGIHLRPSTMVVKAFGESKREVIGEIALPV